MSGLLSAAMVGLGDGMAQSGQFLMRVRADEEKEKRLRKYEMEREKRQQEFQTGLLGKKWDREDVTRAEDRDWQMDRDELSHERGLEKLEAKHDNSRALAEFKADLARREEGMKPTSQMRQYLEMREMGKSHEQAFSTAYGDYITVSDPVYGGSKVIGKGEWDVRAETVPARDEEGRVTGLDFSATDRQSQAPGATGSGLLSGGFDSAGASPNPAAPSGGPGPQPGGPQPPVPEGLLSPSGPQRSLGYGGGGRDPHAASESGLIESVPGAASRFAERLRQNSPVPSVRDSVSGPPQETQQQGGKTQAERIIERIPDPQVKQEAMALLDEAKELLAAEPGEQAVIEQALTKRLRELGIRL